MNKTDFADELARTANISKAKALGITNAMIDILSKALNEKEKIHFIGFGTFETRHSPERMARNPRTNEPVTIPARYKTVFKPSNSLLNKLNGSIAE